MGGILEQAVKDVNELKEVTLAHAKSSLLEAVVPKMKEFVDAQLGETDVALEMPVYEKRAKAEDDLEDVEPVQEPEDEVEEQMEMSEAKKKKDDDDEDKDEDLEEAKMDEAELEENTPQVVEFSESDLKESLRKALEEVRSELTEANVSKGFKDVQNVNDHDGPGERGMEKKEKKDTHWSDVKPPNAKDWTVKEAAYKRKIDELSSVLREYKEAYNEVSSGLKDATLFNRKLVYVTKLFQEWNLTNRQKSSIIDQFDAAQTPREVSLVYKSLSESLKIAGVLEESKGSSKFAKASKTVTSSSSMLKEALKKENDEKQGGEGKKETLFEGWQRIAGLVS